MQDISVDQLADSAGITPCHFIRLFTARKGISPYQYLLRSRINASEKLLSETSLPIVKISEEVGFFTAKNFTRIFKKLTGMTPSEFRCSLGNN